MIVNEPTGRFAAHTLLRTWSPLSGPVWSFSSARVKSLLPADIELFKNHAQSKVRHVRLTISCHVVSERVATQRQCHEPYLAPTGHTEKQTRLRRE
jgi:hypothetical protein